MATKTCAQKKAGASVEYEHRGVFSGAIGRSFDESTSPWPMPVRSNPGAPNVLFIVLDDIHVDHLGCYGAPIRTPNIDRLAKRGLRYTNMSSTAPCASSRSCLLTGRLLRERGFFTFAIGKWHLTPLEPADRLEGGPLGRGFDRHYGATGREASAWLVDRAIGAIRESRQAAAETPFYMCFGISAAQQASADGYRGAFDEGWDEVREVTFARQLAMRVWPRGTRLPPRDPNVPAWDSLSPEERRHAAAEMEAFASGLEQTDREIGRLLGFLEEIGELDDTIIMVIAERCAGEGPSCWPSTRSGGAGVPFIVHWPSGFDSRGELRHQPVQAVDVVPTILECLGISAAPSVEGVSFSSSFDDTDPQSELSGRRAPPEARSSLRRGVPRPRCSIDRPTRRFDRPHSIVAELEIPEEGAEGVLVARGGADGGFRLYVEGGRLHYVFVSSDRQRTHLVSDRELPRGRLTVRVEIEWAPSEPSTTLRRATMFVGGERVGAVDVPYESSPPAGSSADMSIGRDDCAPTTEHYAAPFPFSGTLESVTIDVSGELWGDIEIEAAMVMV